MDTTLNIAVLVGSIRQDALNKKLAAGLARLAPPGFVLEQIRIDDLPLYNQDDDAHPSAPVQRLRSQIAAANGVLFVTPEYNRSVPGVLKNAIDHASRPYGQSVWSGKPGAVLGISVGSMGTSMAQQHLRNILAYLDVPTLGQPEVYLHYRDEFFTPEGDIGEASRTFLQDWMDRYVAWVKQHA